MTSPFLQIVGNLPTILFTQGDKTNSVQFTNSLALKRSGGPSPTTAFSDFIAFLAHAFTSLRGVFNNTHCLGIPLEIHYAQDDGLVNASNFKRLNNDQQRNENEAHLIQYARGRHHLHGRNNYNQVRLVQTESDELSTQNQIKQ